MKQYIDLILNQKSKYKQGKKAVAEKMLTKGIPLEEIIELTESSPKEIEKLKE